MALQPTSPPGMLRSPLRQELLRPLLLLMLELLEQLLALATPDRGGGGDGGLGGGGLG